MTEKLLSTHGAAQLLGVHRKTILRMAQEGRLDGAWYVPTGNPQGRKIFLESRLLEYRDRQIQFAASQPAASA